MANLKIVSALLGLQLCAGCASITGTTGQNVSIQTFEMNGKEVSGAMCDMSNNKGKWFITTPGSTSITRSNDNLIVICKKEQLEPGSASVVSATKGAMFGNILFGGGIGAVIDHNTGAAYEYPAFFKVMMGTSTVIDEQKNQLNAEGSDLEKNKGRSLNKSSPIMAEPAPSENQISMVATSNSVVGVRSKSDSLSKLEQLKELSDRGVITRDEFDRKKKEILDSM